MPELPEVETMVRDLRGRIIGRTLTAVAASFAGCVVWPTYTEFEQRVVGNRIDAIERRGKYALLSLSSGDVLIIHRGMTGSLLLRRAGNEIEPHVRLVLRLDDDSELRFKDPRKFGKVLVMHPAGTERPLPWASMGPEPLNGEFTAESLRRSLAGRKGPIKPLLLNQHIVAGLGNIYVDEALFLAQIHPERPAGMLTAHESQHLFDAIREVLRTAIERRGTTFNNYTDIEGRRGQYQDRLQVFNRTEQPCPRCGTPIRKLVVQSRGTHICPTCQRV